MADIDVERKGGMGWLWWLLGLIILALLIWWFVAAGDDDAEVETVPPVAEQEVGTEAPPPPVPVAQGPFTTVASVLADPAAAAGQPFNAAAPMQVAEVVSDRGFWVEEQGQRLFVVINEGAQTDPQPGTADVQGTQAEMPDVNQGDRVTITEGMLHSAADLQNLQGPIDDQTRQVLQGQQVFLVTDGRNIRKM